MFSINDEYQRAAAYQVYVTDTLYLLGRSICGIEGGGVMKNRFADWLKHEDIEPEPEETADEIINRFISQLGVK